jgi:ribosomal protein S18 acetylase RimI-like enzyme
MRVRRARPEEYATIGAVTIAAYEPFLVGVEDDYRRHLLDAAARDREAEVWVATPDDAEEILGNVTICPSGSSWRELAKDGEGEFRMLAVAPSAQGRGVGGALARLVVERFRSEGASAIVLSSLVSMSGAHRIYDRLGFRRAPDLDWEPEPGIALLAFRLEL